MAMCYRLRHALNRHVAPTVVDNGMSLNSFLIFLFEDTPLRLAVNQIMGSVRNMRSSQFLKIKIFNCQTLFQ